MSSLRITTVSVYSFYYYYYYSSRAHRPVLSDSG